MDRRNSFAQKVKGKYQKVKGVIEMNTGNKSQGIIDKAKGSVNASIADLKMALTNNSSHE